jgi:hypothetical protein
MPVSRSNWPVSTLQCQHTLGQNGSPAKQVFTLVAEEVVAALGKLLDRPWRGLAWRSTMLSCLARGACAALRRLACTVRSTRGRQRVCQTVTSQHVPCSAVTFVRWVEIHTLLQHACPRQSQQWTPATIPLARNVRKKRRWERELGKPLRKHKRSSAKRRLGLWSRRLIKSFRRLVQRRLLCRASWHALRSHTWRRSCGSLSQQRWLVSPRSRTMPRIAVGRPLACSGARIAACVASIAARGCLTLSSGTLINFVVCVRASL